MIVMSRLRFALLSTIISFLLPFSLVVILAFIGLMNRPGGFFSGWYLLECLAFLFAGLLFGIFGALVGLHSALLYAYVYRGSARSLPAFASIVVFCMLAGSGLVHAEIIILDQGSRFLTAYLGILSTAGYYFCSLVVAGLIIWRARAAAIPSNVIS